MNGETIHIIGFYLWWILINGFLAYAEFDFLLRFTHTKRSQPYQTVCLLIYVSLSCCFTIITIRAQATLLSVMMQYLVFFLCGIVLLRLRPTIIIVPFFILFTLSTLWEGFSTVVMRFLVGVLKGQAVGIIVQMLLSAAFAGLFLLALRFLARRYSQPEQSPAAPYLSILFFPCVFLIRSIRISLGLDGQNPPFQALPTGEAFLAFLRTFLWMFVALITFFIIIEVFHKMKQASQQKMEAALLADQLKQQRNYIAEAQTRNDHYRSFQHDINNHLIVLSGLLKEKRYEEAQKYLDELKVAASNLTVPLATGHAALDILLAEKIRYAKQNNISVTCQVKIPPTMTMDDTDLCMLFFNAMDNAIHACEQSVSAHKTITITTTSRHRFLLIDIENSIDQLHHPVVFGTGLKNMEQIAKKYEGTLKVKTLAHAFHISILICPFAN